MVKEDELLITYGLGYAFEKSKLLIVSEIEEKTILKKELDIMKEINAINKLEEDLRTKCDFKYPKNYISNVEEALEEKLTKVIPIITSIKTKNTKKQDYLMDEYIKKDLSQMRLRREGYIQKDCTVIKRYLDNCNVNFGKNREEKGRNYNKIILKIILTSKFGNDFSNFLSIHGQAPIKDKIEKSMEKQIENRFKDEYLIKKKYNELDFLNLLLFLEEWQEKYFSWDKKYTSLMFSINKNGEKYNGPKSEIKDYLLSFIRKRKYLYFPFGRYNNEDMFVTLNDTKYCQKKQSEGNNIESKKSYTVLEKKKGNLYEITSNNYKEIDLHKDWELGYLLSYDKDNVSICIIQYNVHSKKIICLNQYDELKDEMLKALEEHFIV